MGAATGCVDQPPLGSKLNQFHQTKTTRITVPMKLTASLSYRVAGRRRCLMRENAPSMTFRPLYASR